MAITVHYFIVSFNSVLPWTICNPEWENYTAGGDNITCTDNILNGTTKSIPEMYFK